MDKHLMLPDLIFIQQRKRVIYTYLLFYYCVFITFALTHRLLTQNEPVFFSHNRDLTELFIIATGLPKLMISHKWLFLMADTCLFLFPFIIGLYYWSKGKLSWIIGSVFVIFTGLYIHLENIFLSVTPTMYIGIALMGLVFMTNTQRSFYSIIALCRYFFLYTMFSAAVWKILRGTIFNYHEMSNILLLQHANVLSTNCQDIACRLYFYLIDHPAVSYLLFLTTVLLESFFIVGFFTRKYNGLLFVLTVLFFTGNILIMRIPFWPFLLPAVTLLVKDDLSPGNIFSYKQWKNIYAN